MTTTVGATGEPTGAGVAIDVTAGRRAQPTRTVVRTMAKIVVARIEVVMGVLFLPPVVVA